MKVSPTLASILHSIWALDSKYVLSWYPQVNNWLNGVVEIDESQKISPFSFTIANENSESEDIEDVSDAPKNSVAVFNIEGPMTAKGDWCSYGTEYISKQIKKAIDNTNIVGCVIRYDTGGGTTDSVVPLIEIFDYAKQAGKPTVAHVKTALSAGYWSACNNDSVIAAHDMAEFGSVGVFVRFPNLDKYYKSQGLEYIEIYAPESDYKNQPYLQALEGKVKLMQTDVLSPHAQKFQSVVKEARGTKLVLSTPGLISGKVFFAKDAIENGLADEIGNLQSAVNRVYELSSNNPISKLTASNKSIYNSNPIIINTMDKKQIPALLFVLGYDNLEIKDKVAFMSKEDVTKLQNYSQEKFGKNINFTNATFEEDGSVNISDAGLLSLNSDFTNALLEANSNLSTKEASKIEALEKKHAEKIAAEKITKQNEVAELQAQIDKLADEPENAELVQKIGEAISDKFSAPAKGLNVVDDLHPWNQAALERANGNNKRASYLIATGLTKSALSVFQQELIVHGSTNMNIDQMNDVFGEFHRQVAPEIKDMMVVAGEISSLFPWRSTGIKDELSSLSVYVKNFLQPRNSEWAEKGGFEIQADLIKVKNWQVSHRYTAAEMWQFIESWLAEKTIGTDPFQESLVSWFTTKMFFQMWNIERPVNAIRGVYKTPVAGTAGKSINSMDGLFINLIRLMADNRILPYKVGKGTHIHLIDGEVNRNHVYYKIQDMIKRIPRDLRDAFNWNVYISKEDYRQCEIFIKQVIASDANFKEQEAAENFANFTRKAVPHWQDGLIVITQPGNILQGYREKADDNRVYFDKEKRDTIVFMDGAYIISPTVSGKKYETYDELLASEGLYQRVFTNAEFGPFTPIEIDADDTSPSIALHNVLITQANTGATVITTIDDANIGDTIYILGGSNTNPSSIDDANVNFIGLSADITFDSGVVAKFIKTEATKFTLVALYQETSVGAIQFDADDVTPDVSQGQLFITNPDNTTGNKDITDFAGATVGVPFKVLGGGGSFPSEITKAAKFAYISATWIGDEGKEILLQKRPDGLFVEVIE
ncbi:MAG: S49 family peptidase [Bacteroidales bacterium]|nr:S49 family peptidase [Bacteroidales bacterium]